MPPLLPLSRPLRLAASAALALLVLPVASAPQQKTLTFEDLHEPGRRPNLNGSVPNLTWLDDTHYLLQRGGFGFGRRGAQGGGGGGAADGMKVEADTGKEEPYSPYDRAKLEAALAAQPGMSADEARRTAQFPLRLNPAKTGGLVTLKGDLYHYDFASGTLARITQGGDQQDAAFSPNGACVAFRRGNNLYVADVAKHTERALTTDGGPDVLNGRFSWVYAEEVYGRFATAAFWWSPDSRYVAFLQFDEKPVPQYPVIDHLQLHNAGPVQRYPRPGDPNPAVRLGIVAADGGAPVWADTSRYPAGSFLIVRVAWAPGGKSVVYQVQNREQTWLEVNTADPSTGSSAPLLTEQSKAWIEALENPHWLKDGSFLWFSERTGWKHLYHYAANGKLIAPVTSGEWDVETLYGVDEAGDWVYFSGTRSGPIVRDAFRIHMNGMSLERLTPKEGTHAPRFNPGLTRFLDYASDYRTPTQVRLYRTDGTEVRLIEANPVPALQQYKLSGPELVRVTARDGFVLEGKMLKPPDFNPNKKYPVMQLTYAGPQMPLVRNAWSPDLFAQLIAQQGVVVWWCDNRSASGKGVQSAWPVHKNLGELELRDIEDGLAWLRQQPYIDGSRIGIMGGSYGGYMVCYALTHSQSFALGVAESSPTDWRDYDTIYTERYMGLPDQNPEGYRKSSALDAAANLHGKLILIHGTMDDNVHVQNTLRFAYALAQAGKQFQMMLYPRSGHGIADPGLRRHKDRMVLDAIQETLVRPAP